MIEFLKIPDKERRTIYQDVSNKIGLPPQAIEKDVWVTLVLQMIFTSDHADRFVFKGGTSLSKAFNLIQRFSEDVDLGLDRTTLGFEGDLSKGQIRKLRRACHSYVSEELPKILNNRLIESGVNPDWYQLNVENTKISDQDPGTLQVNFHSLFEEVPYLANNIKIEVSARSLIEPHLNVEIQSWVDQQYPKAPFIGGAFNVVATDPRKTFLEKLILLHEEFQKPIEKIRHLRMSRHFYDIGQLIHTEYGQAAIVDQDLFNSIIDHRRALTPMPNTNYGDLAITNLGIVPPDEFYDLYDNDYKKMQNSMIHGETMDFKTLIEIISEALN